MGAFSILSVPPTPWQIGGGAPKFRRELVFFVVKFRPKNGWWFYENVRAHPPVLLGVTLFKGIYRQVVMCQTCSVVPVLIWFHFVSLKRL